MHHGTRSCSMKNCIPPEAMWSTLIKSRVSKYNNAVFTPIINEQRKFVFVCSFCKFSILFLSPICNIIAVNSCESEDDNPRLTCGNSTAAGVQCSKYCMCTVQGVINISIYYEKYLPSERQAFIYYTVLLQHLIIHNILFILKLVVNISDSDRGNLRLVGGNSTAGRLQMQLDGEWTQVCSDGFSAAAANVACSHDQLLGLRSTGTVHTDGR